MCFGRHKRVVYQSFSVLLKYMSSQVECTWPAGAFINDVTQIWRFSDPLCNAKMESCAPSLTSWNFVFSLYRKIEPSCLLNCARHFASPRP